MNEDEAANARLDRKVRAAHQQADKAIKESADTRIMKYARRAVVAGLVLAALYVAAIALLDATTRQDRDSAIEQADD